MTRNVKIISDYPSLDTVPILVDECDPAIGAIYGIYDNPNYVIRNTEYYPSMVAAMIETILSISPRIQLMTHWAFYMEGKRLFEGNRSLMTNYNLYAPMLNGLKLFERLKSKQYSIKVHNNTIPISGFATFDETTSDIQLMLFSHVDDYTFHGTQTVTVVVNNVDLQYVLVKHYRIDGENNNNYAEWVRMGQPTCLSDEQVKYFRNYQQLTLFNTPVLYEIRNRTLALDGLSISAHSIDLFEIINVE